MPILYTLLSLWFYFIYYTVQNNEDGANFLWYIIITIGGIFGILNVVKYFKYEDTMTEYEKIIMEKDLRILELETKLKQYEQGNG